MEADVPYGGWHRAAGAACGEGLGVGILVGGDCRVAGTFHGKCWKCEACSGCGNRVVVTAQHASVGALVCNCCVVSGTSVSMSMEIRSPTSSWYLIMGMTQGQCQGGGALFGSRCRIAVAIPGEHLEAVAVTS